MNVETSRTRIDEVRVLFDQPTLRSIITHLVMHGDPELWARAIDAAEKVEAGDRTTEDGDGNQVNPLDVLVGDVDALVDAYHPLHFDLSAEAAFELGRAVYFAVSMVKAGEVA